MRTLIITLLCLCSLTFSVPAKSQSPDDLKRMSTMIVQAKSKTEILQSWESLVKRNPKMNVNKTINAIIGAAKQENDKNKSSSSYSAVSSLIGELQKQMYESARKILDNLKS